MSASWAAEECYGQEFIKETDRVSIITYRSHLPSCDEGSCTHLHFILAHASHARP
jgi:hypothetical protein